MVKEKKRSRWRELVLILGVCAVGGILALTAATPATAQEMLSGDEIRVVQENMHSLGYYAGKIDGVYGVNTAQAVKAFQKANGLPVDGIVSGKTAERLGVKRPTARDMQSDIYLLSWLIESEAGQEEYVGKLAVGAVALNRVGSPEYPNSLPEVIYELGYFWLSDRNSQSIPDEECIRAARDAMNGVDPTDGSTGYYSSDVKIPQYLLEKEIVTVIGNRKFCK